MDKSRVSGCEDTMDDLRHVPVPDHEKTKLALPPTTEELVA